MSALLALSLAACSWTDGYTPPNVTCAPDLSYLESGWGPRGLVVSPEPVPFVRPDGSSLEVERLFPSGTSSGYSYWLRTGETFDMTLRLMVGTTYPGDGVWHAFVYVDGQAAPLVGASATGRVDVTARDGLGELDVRLPSTAFPEGASTLHVWLHYDYGPLSTLDRHTMMIGPLAIYRDDYVRRATPMDTPGGTSGPIANPEYGSVVRIDGASTPVAGFFATPADPDYPFDLVLQPSPALSEVCTTESETLAVLAFLDDEPYDIGPGSAVFATLAGTEARHFAAHLHLPIDGVRHRIQLVQLGGIGSPTDYGGEMLTAQTWPAGELLFDATWE